MDNDDNQVLEPSSSHIYENANENQEAYLPADDNSNNLNTYGPFNHEDDIDQISNSEDEELQANCEGGNCNHQYNTRPSASDQKTDYHTIGEMGENEVDGSQPGCSSSSGSHNHVYRYFETVNIHSQSEASPQHCGSDGNFAHSSCVDVGSSKQADSNCLENGKDIHRKSFTMKTSTLYINSLDADNEGEQSEPNEQFIDPSLHLSNACNYDSDSCDFDDLDTITSCPSQTSSPHSRATTSRNPPACFLNEEESFMVASSSEELGHLSDIMHLKSPRTPGDSCLVSSSTGQLDSLPPTPLNFQGNDVSHTSAASSPLHPPVLDSTVDSTSGQHVSSPYCMQSVDDDDVGVQHVNPTSAPDEKNEISTSVPHLHQLDNTHTINLHISQNSEEENCINTDHTRSHFIRQYLIEDVDTLGKGESKRSEGESSVLTSSSSAYIEDSLAIPGTSGITHKKYFSNSKQYAPGITNEAHPMNSISFGVDHSAPSDSSLQVGLLGLEICDTEVESSSLVATSATLSRKENSMSDFSSSHHYVLEITDDSGRDSSVALDCLEPDKDDRNTNFQDSERHQKLRNLSPHVLEIGQQLEPTQNIDFIQSSSFSNNITLANEVLHISDLKELMQENRDCPSNTYDSEYIGQFYKKSITSAAKNPMGVFEELLQEPSEKAVLQIAPVTSDTQNNGSVSLAGGSQRVNIHSLFGNRPNCRKTSKLIPWRTSAGHMVVTKQKHKFSESLFNKSNSCTTVSSVQFSVPDDVNERLAEGSTDSAKDAALKSLMDSGSEHLLVECSTKSTDREKENSEATRSTFICIDSDALYKSEVQHSIAADRSLLNSIDSLNYKEDTGFWCSDCEKFLKHKCSTHRVQTIMDKPILTRAWASLPAQHLVIKLIPESLDPVLGVFSRRYIPKRTQFGPLEGTFTEDEPQNVGLTFKCVHNKMVGYVDLSSEDSSNWMRFVRPAHSYMKINCVAIEEEENIYFLTTTNLPPKTELRVGYSKQYAVKFGLTPLTATEEELKALEIMKKTWLCYECDEGFETSAELQNHLGTHDKEKYMDKRCKKKGRTKRSKQSVKKGKKMKTSNEGTFEEGESKSDVSEKSTIYECSECPLCFDNSELLRFHQLVNSDHSLAASSSPIENVDDPDYKKVCPACSTEFSSLEEAREHVKQHSFISPSYQNSFKCELCYKSFGSKERLESHTATHKNEAEKPYACRLCTRRFCKKSALASHMMFHTDPMKVYHCPICRDQLNSINDLKMHFPKHCIAGHYTCPTCFKKFPSYFQIRRHIRSYHSEVTFPCHHCGKQLPSFQKLNIHMLIHSDKMDFSCPVCPKRFKRKDKMKEHLKRMHTLKKEQKKMSSKFVPKVNPNDYRKFLYKCSHCFLGFKRRGMLINHFSKRHPEIPISSVPELNQPILRPCRTYICQYCGKSYGTVAKRKDHILKNHPGKDLPSITSFCDSSESDKIRKMYPASCPWCPRQYMTNAKLLQHQRSHHANMIENKNVDKEREYLVDEPLEESKSSSSVVQVCQISECHIPEVAEVELNIVEPGDDVLVRTIGHSTSQKKFAKGMNLRDPEEMDQNLDGAQTLHHVKGQGALHQLHINENVLVNVPNVSPVLIEGSASSPEGNHPYVLLTQEGGEPYTVAFRPSSLFSNVITYPVLSPTVSKEVNGLASTLHDSCSSQIPIDMRSSKQKNCTIYREDGSPVVKTSEENLSQFSLDISSLKNDSCILAQVQSQVGAETSLVVCQPFLSFTQSTL